MNDFPPPDLPRSPLAAPPPPFIPPPEINIQVPQVVQHTEMTLSIRRIGRGWECSGVAPRGCIY